MMTKRKSETQNPVNYWWNEFLFVKHFIVETDLSRKEVADCLRTLHHDREGFWFPRACSVAVNDSRSAIDTSITFDIRRKRYNRGVAYTTAKAEGSVITDGGTGLTIVRGRVKFGWVYYANILAMPIIFLVFFGLSSARVTSRSPFAFTPFIVMLVIISGWHWWSLFRDRSALISDIAAVLDSRKAKEK